MHYARDAIRQHAINHTDGKECVPENSITSKKVGYRWIRLFWNDGDLQMREFLNEDSSVVAFKQQRTVYGPAS